MFAQLHSAQPNNGMVMVGNGDGNRVKVLVLLIKHFPPVVIKLCFRELFPALRAWTVIHIAQKGYFGIFLWGSCEMMNVIFRLAAGAYGSNVQLITWSGI